MKKLSKTILQNVIIENRTEFYNTQVNVKIAEGIKICIQITIDFFKSKGKIHVIPNEGLVFTFFICFSNGSFRISLVHGFKVLSNL
jgi:hypothetical protein